MICFRNLPGMFVLIATLATQSALAQSQGKLPIVNLSAGIHVVRAELASTTESRMQGLMHRKSLGANEGMLFVFSQDDRHCMWMKNTFIPLSVAFIDAGGKIVSIHDMTPHDETSHCAAGPARFALEMTKGWFKSKGVQSGARISGLDKLTAQQ